MPTISMFYGILIRMFFFDVDKHKMPHIHAEFQGEKAVYSIPSGELLAGEINPKKQKLIVAWIEIHQDDLSLIQSTAVCHQPYCRKHLLHPSYSSNSHNHHNSNRAMQQLLQAFCMMM